jgi:hypothetical protein
MTVQTNRFELNEAIFLFPYRHECFIIYIVKSSRFIIFAGGVKMNRLTFQTIVILAFCVAAFGAEAKVSKTSAEKSREPEPIPEAISLDAVGLYSTNILTDASVKDYLIEQFVSTEDAFDLAYHSVTFVPTQDSLSYTVEVQQILQLPTDPAKGNVLTLGDDTYSFVKLSDSALVSIYGISFTGFYVGSNGYITFTEGDQDYTESPMDHFDTLRISGLFRDLNPTIGGQVSYKQLADRVAVSWQNVPEFNIDNFNTFQIEMFFDGTIRISWTDVGAVRGIVGLSDGLGVPPDFQETDFSELSKPPIPPITGDYLTEQFVQNDDPFDLEYTSVTFFPTSDGTSYVGLLQYISQLPTNPINGIKLGLRDDNFAWVRLSSQGQVRIFNQSFSSFFVGSNGYITFTQPDNDFTETLEEHFDKLRISGLYTDLTLSYTGTASAKQLYDRVAITWQEIPEFENTAHNTFQIEMFYDGKIRISWLEIGSRSNIVGLSNGLGLSPDFEETDFSIEYAP